MRWPSAHPIASAIAPEIRKRTDSARNGGASATTMRAEVKAELHAATKNSPSAIARQSIRHPPKQNRPRPGATRTAAAHAAGAAIRR